MTVAVGIGSRRRRSRLPRTQASSKVKDSSVNESPSCLRASSCAAFFLAVISVAEREGGGGGELRAEGLGSGKYHTSLGGAAMGPAGAGGCRALSSASGRRLQTLVVDIVVD